MKFKKLLVLVASAPLAAVAFAQSTTPDATQITSDISAGVDSGMTVTNKVIAALVAIFLVGMVVKLIKKGRAAV